LLPLIIIMQADRLPTGFSDLQSETAVVVLVPDRRMSLGADLADETPSNQR
jgi:hypothetical protein